MRVLSWRVLVFRIRFYLLFLNTSLLAFIPRQIEMRHRLFLAESSPSTFPSRMCSAPRSLPTELLVWPTPCCCPRWEYRKLRLDRIKALNWGNPTQTCPCHCQYPSVRWILLKSNEAVFEGGNRGWKRNSALFVAGLMAKVKSNQQILLLSRIRKQSCWILAYMLSILLAKRPCVWLFSWQRWKTMSRPLVQKCENILVWKAWRTMFWETEGDQRSPTPGWIIR